MGIRGTLCAYCMFVTCRYVMSEIHPMNQREYERPFRSRDIFYWTCCHIPELFHILKLFLFILYRVILHCFEQSTFYKVNQ